MAWNITQVGMNNMLGNYFGFHLTPKGFSIVHQSLEDLNEGNEFDYDENDNSISDTLPREVIIDTIVEKFVEGHKFWPCNGDSEETQANFVLALEATLNDGLSIKRLSEKD